MINKLTSKNIAKLMNSIDTKTKNIEVYIQQKIIEIMSLNVWIT